MPCRPHDWREPLPFDHVLTCEACGRVLVLDDCEAWRLNAIARAGSLSFRTALLVAVRMGRPGGMAPADSLGGARWRRGDSGINTHAVPG